VKNGYEALMKNLEQLQKRVSLRPEKGIVLGSGLGDYARQIESPEFVPYAELEDFPQSTAQGHMGRFVFGYLSGRPIVAMQGRVHYYEGYEMDEVVRPIRLMGLMGVKELLLTNAAGGINPGLNVGDLMLIEDHISSFVPSPLRGENREELGPRFPDMTEVYSARLRRELTRSAGELAVPLKKGVYLQTPGPAYETPAEIRMFSALGADVVGMSTVCEAIAARHMGMEVCGISCVTNLAAGLGGKPLSHQEVGQAAMEASNRFAKLVSAFVALNGQK